MKKVKEKVVEEPKPIELTEKVCATCAYGWKYGMQSIRCKHPSLNGHAEKADMRGHCVDWKPNAYVEILQKKAAG